MPLLAACGSGERALLLAQPADNPQYGLLATPRVYRSAWWNVASGQSPPEFVDVRRDGWSYYWLYDGGWRIRRAEGLTFYEVPWPKTEPREPLTFRRYNGTVFGWGGGLPPRYRITGQARSRGGSTRFNGYGEVAIQAFYVNPTTYVEVLQTDRHLCLWEARNAPPMQGAGWRLIARIESPARIGEWIQLGCEINTRTGDVIGYKWGRAVLRGKSSLLTSGARPRFTIRATGNREDWHWVEAREIL